MWASRLRVVEDARERLASLPLFVNLDRASSIAVLGDVHGYDDVVDRFEQLVEEYSVDAAVMLGDYVDRGPNSTETIIRVLELVSSDPSRFIPVRGDHEDPRMNEAYGFYEEVLYSQATDLYSLIVDAYAQMPIAATWRGVFLVHGGVPCADCSAPERPLRLDEAQASRSRVKGTRSYLNLEDPVLFQLAWNDPISTPVYFEPNPRGPGIYYYGRLAWSSFLRENGLKYIVRAHEVVDGLLLLRRDGRPASAKCESRIPSAELEGGVVTVFSSRYHGGRSGALLIDEEGATLKCL